MSLDSINGQNCQDFFFIAWDICQAWTTAQTKSNDIARAKALVWTSWSVISTDL